MKYIYILLISYFFFINSNVLYAEDSLTVKQQLDRIMEEVKDLNKAVFNKSFDNTELKLNLKHNDAEKFTSIDIRIYDLEKDIKNLTLQFEEILFKLDDLSNEIYSLETQLVSSFEKKLNTDINITNEKNLEEIIVKEENTLGKIIISNKNEDLNNTEKENLDEDNDRKQVTDNLTPEEQLQFALDQMMKKNYNKSKDTLEEFIINFPENQISGSAHFWLGKIYLFESDYRKAAIIFGEGVQKFPESIKAAEMYYLLAKSLKEMKKNPEACKTLYLLEKNYKDNKFAKDPEKIKTELNCKNEN